MNCKEVSKDVFLPTKIGMITDEACEALSKDGMSKESLLLVVADALHRHAVDNGADQVLVQILGSWADGTETADETFSMLADYNAWETANRPKERNA